METHVLETVSKALMPIEARSPEAIVHLEDDEVCVLPTHQIQDLQHDIF